MLRGNMEGHESWDTAGNQQPQWKTSVWLVLAKQRMGGPLGDRDRGRGEQPQPAGPERHTASQRARQASPHAHAHPVYLRDRGAVPLTGGGLMHHPLGKEFFQAHVIIQDHLQERALGGGGETTGYPREMVWSEGGWPHPSVFWSNITLRHHSHKPGSQSGRRRPLGGGSPHSSLTLMGPSRMICPSLAMLSYSWMAARR